MKTQTSRVFPVPLWVCVSLLNVAELSLSAWLCNRFVAPRLGGAWAVVLWLLEPFALRVIIALASYGLSRWRGVALTPAQQLGALAWVRFFVTEYFQLCLQNLLLLPLRGFFRTASERGQAGGGGRVLLLQHGYVNSGAVWFFTARALERSGYRVFTIDQPVFASIDVMAERLAARVDDVRQRTGAKQITLVAHSMGGLICRAYLRRFGGAAVAQLITLGSPHHGTHHAYLAAGENGAQMRPGNAWLAALNAVPVTLPFVSLYSVHDTVISPQDSSAMPDAQNIVLSGIGHVSMPSGRAMRAHLRCALQLLDGAVSSPA
ncbi:MAG: alpha/beta fold hydrolase [Burkholderiales bacterium]|nr:alpha/beta fold hydrolase [Burkholderiales bacterium]